jgi:hypothetical protein
MDRFIAFAGTVVCILGCSGGTSNRSLNGSGTFSNSAVLTGDPVGLDLDLPSKLARIVPASVTGSDMAGDKAYLGRFSATSDAYYLILPVTNQGTRLQCFVKVVTFDLLNADGSSGGTPIATYVSGSVGRSSKNSVYTNTCIAPGETAYLLDSADGTFATLASVQAVMSGSTDEFLPPQSSVVPLSYSAGERGEPYTVTIANQGPVSAVVYNATAVYFDDADLPVVWDDLWAVTNDAGVSYKLAPGATGLMASYSTTWTGNSTRQLVMVDFDAYQLSTTSPDVEASKVFDVARLRTERRQRLQSFR